MRGSSNQRYLLRNLLLGLGLLTSLALTGCQIETGGQTLPSPYYMSDDVQYFPPGPEFKLAKEAELFQVGTLDPMIIRAQVHEIEAQKLKENMAATVTFDSIPGKKYAASVSRIPWAPIPAALQQPSYYDVELTIPNPSLELKEGLKGQIIIQPGK